MKKLRTISDIEKEFKECFEDLMYLSWKNQFDAEYQALDGNTGSLWSNKEIERIRDNFFKSLRELLEQVVIEKEANQNVSEYYSGFNACRQQIKEIINEILK